MSQKYPHQQGTFSFYLETEEEAFAKIFDEEPDERDKKVEKRNELRRKLRSTFESISVSILSLPAQNLYDLDPSNTSEEFQERVDLLKNEILRQMSEPRKFGTNAVNFQNVDSLVRIFVKQLEDVNFVHVQSAVMQYQLEEINKEKQCFEESLEEYYEEIDLPVIDGLEEQLTQKKEVLLEKFKNKTANIDLEVKYRETVLERLKHFARTRMDDKMRENQRVIEAEQQVTLMTSVDEFRSAVKSEIQNCEMASTEMQQHFEDQMNMLVNSFMANTAQLDRIQEMVQEELEGVKNWAKEKFDQTVEDRERSEQERGAYSNNKVIVDVC